MNYIIAIDGPAGGGKSLAAKKTAIKLRFTYIDTGALYRCITLEAIKIGFNFKDPNKKDINRLAQYAENIGVSFNLLKDETLKVIVENRDVSEDIRSSEISNKVPLVARILKIRHAVLASQRSFAKKNSIVIEGRDIGTIVFPQAQVKIFLTASADVRAKRRFSEYQKKGNNKLTIKEVKQDILERDKKDTVRKTSPLKKADDAIEIDSSSMNREEVVGKILKVVRGKINIK